jgi:hypothetical protein
MIESPRETGRKSHLKWLYTILGGFLGFVMGVSVGFIALASITIIPIPIAGEIDMVLGVGAGIFGAVNGYRIGVEQAGFKW